MKKRMKNKYDDYNKSRRTWRKMMALLLVLISVMALIGCGGNKNEPLHGEYHTEANGHKRGIDLDVTPAKVTGIIQNLQNMGPDGINEIEVELDENGIPTAVNGIPQEWIPDGCTDCAGMLILGVQDALAKR